MRPLIIERPDLQSRVQRIGGLTVTLVFWLIWVYVWVPVATLVVWALELKFLYQHMVVLSGGAGLLRVLPYYLLAVIAMGVLLIGWAKLNERRFRGLVRRGPAAAVGAQALARHFEVEPAHLLRWQHAQCLLVELGPDGGIARVESLPLQGVTGDCSVPEPDVSERAG